MTRAQIRALKFLQSHGGSGVVDKQGRLLAMGEHRDDNGGFAPETWLRLIASEHVAGSNGRICMTAKGIAATERKAA